MAFIIDMAIVGIVAAVVLFLMVMIFRSDRAKQTAPLRRAERHELKSARATLDSINRLAMEYRALDNTDLPYKINDLIDIHERDTK